MSDETGKKKRIPAKNKMPKPAAGIVGLGLDGTDGHTRITTGKNFKLIGGSKDTHEVMQETALKINEELDRRHKRLEDITPPEFVEILRKAKPE